MKKGREPAGGAGGNDPGSGQSEERPDVEQDEGQTEQTEAQGGIEASRAGADLADLAEGAFNAEATAIALTGFFGRPVQSDGDEDEPFGVSFTVFVRDTPGDKGEAGSSAIGEGVLGQVSTPPPAQAADAPLAFLPSYSLAI